MAKKAIPQKTVSQLEYERNTRFNTALQKIAQGESRKKAILESGMDPRTFNKQIERYKDSNELYLTKTDSKGHYRLSGKVTAYARWQVFHKDGAITYEHVDYETSRILGRYWNAVRSDLSGYGNIASFKPDHIYNIYGEKIMLEKDSDTLEAWHASLMNEKEAASFNEDIYAREYA